MDVSQEQTTVSFSTHWEASQTQDVEGCASLDSHNIFKNWIVSRLVLLYGQYTLLCMKFRARQLWSLHGHIHPQEQHILLIENGDFLANTSCLKEISQCKATHAMWAGNPLARRGSRRAQELLPRCLLATFAYSCASATAISSVSSPPRVLSADRELGGGRESENEREKEADKIKKNKKHNLTPPVIFSDKSWHPVFIESAPLNFCRGTAEKRKNFSSLPWQNKMRSPQVITTVRVGLLKGLRWSLTAFDFKLLPQSQEIHLSCNCTRANKWGCPAVCRKSAWRPKLSFWPQFSCPSAHIIHGSCFGLLSQRQWAPQLWKIQPNVPSRQSHPEAELGAPQGRSREKNLSCPVVPVPLWEPLHSCSVWSPAFPAWPEWVKWLETIFSVLTAGISVPCEGQDTSTRGLKGSPELLVSLTFSPLWLKFPLGHLASLSWFSSHLENHQNYLKPGGESVPISREGCWKSDTGDDEGFLMSWLKLTGLWCGVLSFGSASFHHAQKSDWRASLISDTFQGPGFYNWKSSFPPWPLRSLVSLSLQWLFASSFLLLLPCQESLFSVKTTQPNYYNSWAFLAAECTFPFPKSQSTTEWIPQQPETPLFQKPRAGTWRRLNQVKEEQDGSVSFVCWRDEALGLLLSATHSSWGVQAPGLWQRMSKRSHGIRGAPLLRNYGQVCKYYEVAWCS